MLKDSRKITYKHGKSSEHNWYQDRYQRVLVERNFMVIVTVVALIGVLACAFALAYLSPLKTVQPFLITVDEKTGITQTVNPLEDKQLTTNQAVNRYFLVKYIMARESYSAIRYQNDYQIVRLLSTPQVFYEYRVFYDPNNRQSPLVTIGNDLMREVEILSLNMLDESKNLAQVRLRITQSRVGSGNRTVSYHIGYINYMYAQLELPMKERYINPLGFLITSYKLNEDFLQK